MFSFFKRSKTRSNDKHRNPQRKASTIDACASDSKGDSYESPRRSVATTAQVLPHQSHQYDNESVGERAVQSSANTVAPPAAVTQQKHHGGGGFFGDIMAKGRNKRNHNNNNNYSKNKPKADVQTAVAATINHRHVVAGNGVPLLLTSIGDRHEKFDEKQHIGMCAEFVETEGNNTAVAVNAATPSTPNCDATVAADAADFSVKNNSIRYDRLINEDDQEDVGSVATPSLNNTERIAYDDACAQHRDDRNSKQKQNRSADDDDVCADDSGQQPIPSPSLWPQQTGVLTDELVKEIIFEKYKRPVSPLSTTLSVLSYNSPTVNVVAPQVLSSAAQLISTQDEPPLFDVNMGQQPTKHNNLPNPREISVQPVDTSKSPTVSLPVFVALNSPETSPPSSPTQHSPNDDKEIFYEADDDIEFLPTTASDLFNNQPSKNNSVASTFPLPSQLPHRSDQFNNNNSSSPTPLRFSIENYSGNCGNGENRVINNSSDGQVPRNRSLGVRFAVPEDDYEVEHEDENNDNDDDISDDDEVEDVDRVVAATEHLHNNDAVSHEKNTIFEKNNALLDDPDNEDHANYDNDDDDNDSPDSGIDVVTDIAEISQIWHNLEHDTTTKSPPSSLSSSMISSSINIDTSSSSTNQFGGHENSNRIADSDNHNNGRTTNGSSDSSAFNSNGVVQVNGKYSSLEEVSERPLHSVGSDSDEIRCKGESDEFEVSPRKLASLYNGGDISAVSLPDIVESIGSSNNGTSNGTIMVSAADTPTVSRTNVNYSSTDAAPITAEDETHKLIDNEK